MPIDHANLQVRRAQVIFTFEDVDPASQNPVMQRHGYPPSYDDRHSIFPKTLSVATRLCSAKRIPR
jgi:hypothetical protein